MLLTGVNLLLRFAGTVFGVYLSRRIGEQGLGLLQLTMSVGSLAMIAGIGGIRTAAMYLTAEELGRRGRRGVNRVLSGCLRYSLVCSAAVGGLLWVFAPAIARQHRYHRCLTAVLLLLAHYLPLRPADGILYRGKPHRRTGGGRDWGADILHGRYRPLSGPLGRV